MSVFEFYDPFKNPKLKTVQNNTSPDQLAQKIRSLNNIEKQSQSNIQNSIYPKNIANLQSYNHTNKHYWQDFPNLYPYQQFFDNNMQGCIHQPCNNPCKKPHHPNPSPCKNKNVCPRCGMPKKMCNCFPRQHTPCLPNMICFPFAPNQCPPTPCNFPNGFGISFSNISMPMYDDFQSQKSFMFWLNKRC